MFPAQRRIPWLVQRIPAQAVLEVTSMRNLVKGIGTIALAAGFLLSGFGVVPGAKANEAPVANAAAGEKKEKNEKHPYVHRALHELRAAQKSLQEGADDFGGHKEKALKAIDEA